MTQGTGAAMDAAALRRAYMSGTLSPVDVTEAALARIARRAAPLGVFLLVDAEGARAAARACAARWARGAPCGLLDGIPVTVKDQVDTVGLPSRKGSLTSSDAPAAEDAPAMARLREAGAVLLGKTAMCEFGWKGVTDSPLLGVTRNPWAPSRSAGGSSGGAAVAAACDMGVIHLGSDGAGSVRIPAAFCGVYGFKPSFGRVPHHPGGRLGLGHIGPLTRCVADAALALCVLGQPDDRDPSSLPYDPRDWRIGLEDGVAGWRVAYSRKLGHARAAPEVIDLCDRAVDALRTLGAQVEVVDPALPDPRRGFGLLWAASMGHAMAAPTPEPPAPETYRERHRRLTGHALDVCPDCGGPMQERGPSPPRPPSRGPFWCDSS